MSAEIADGEFIVIVGPVGCGKSTLLRMVAGLEEITGGEIAIGGRVVNELEPNERDIAMVFQNYALYPHMSVYDNMAYGLKIAKVPKAEIEVRVDRRRPRSWNWARSCNAQPRELSGGQRQRVAMGRAIVRQPSVFLFDEPLSNLDAKLRAQTRLEIQKLHHELGITSLFVTHDQVEAMTLAQRMIVMNGGRMEQIGTPEEVYARPATTFVAGFIGSPPMNLLRGVADGASFTTGGQTLPLQKAAPCSGELILGLRPEHALWGGSGTDGWQLRGGRGGDARRGAAGVLPLGRDAVHRAHRRHAAASAHWRHAAAADRAGTASLVRRHDTGPRHVMNGWPYPLWIAHRGAGKLAPENTLAAFRVGASHGYRAFECDVKLSADGVPFLVARRHVAAHDAGARHCRRAPLERAVAPRRRGLAQPCLRRRADRKPGGCCRLRAAQRPCAQHRNQAHARAGR